MASADRRLHWALAALLAPVLFGCVTPPPPGGQTPSFVELSGATPGLTERRSEFAAAFQDALRTGADASTSAGAWLHGVAEVERRHIAAVHRLRERFEAMASGTSVLIVPGLFGDCVETQSVPFGDGVERDGARNHTEAYRGYNDLGLHAVRLVSLPGRASIASNGTRVANAIRAEARRPGVRRIVLVAYSKGVADTLQALASMQADGGVPAQLHALVSVAGLVEGSIIVERFGALYRALAPSAPLLGCSHADGAELEGLTREDRAQWLATHALPPQVHYFSVVAHAARNETAPALRPFHDLLSAHDPRNDGQVLAVNALVPRSVLLAEARADHWSLALPLERHPSSIVRSLATDRAFPREALFRALLWWSVASTP